MQIIVKQQAVKITGTLSVRNMFLAHKYNLFVEGNFNLRVIVRL